MSTADTAKAPDVIVWDITYACPLRCSHCYSESGRRPSRQLAPAEMVRVVESIITLKPRVVALSGGEPLLVRGVLTVAEQLVQAGIRLGVNTSGWTLTRPMAERLADLFREVLVSLDGATAEVHDRIRGRVGSHERALRTLALLDSVARERRQAGQPPLRFGIDAVVVNSNRGQLERFCTDIAPRFPHLSALSFNAAVPAGLANRPDFARTELLTWDRLAELAHPALLARLRALAPSTVEVFTADNLNLGMFPDRLATGGDQQIMHIEPDGEVRAMPLYEGTVGNLLHEPADLLWDRARARWRDPFVVEALSAVRTMADWVEATRRLDLRFASDEVRLLIDRRAREAHTAAGAETQAPSC
ncbi:radical SAM protein [Streptomyces albipurpureus]|uniref:Radical SAM protein n=1 Tax=Streptomyces albipurpureus TaxID=2897419 RepID=A0ABT0UUU9_9ACTN|nr:radical SAM protein [Streptomyces sp. CWNU-1]MCM2391895.1 radical SAM protein [Streptomyces sp. CWNU-1]